MKVKKYAGVYEDFAELFDESIVQSIFQNMSGQQVTFPKRLYTKEYVIEQTKEIKTSAELKKAASMYGYTERRLKQLLKEDEKRHL